MLGRRELHLKRVRHLENSVGDFFSDFEDLPFGDFSRLEVHQQRISAFMKEKRAAKKSAAISKKRRTQPLSAASRKYDSTEDRTLSVSTATVENSHLKALLAHGVDASAFTSSGVDDTSCDVSFDFAEGYSDGMRTLSNCLQESVKCEAASTKDHSEEVTTSQPVRAPTAVDTTAFHASQSIEDPRMNAIAADPLSSTTANATATTTANATATTTANATATTTANATANTITNATADGTTTTATNVTADTATTATTAGAAVACSPEASAYVCGEDVERTESQICAADVEHALNLLEAPISAPEERACSAHVIAEQSNGGGTTAGTHPDWHSPRRRPSRRRRTSFAGVVNQEEVLREFGSTTARGSRSRETDVHQNVNRKSCSVQAVTDMCLLLSSSEEASGGRSPTAVDVAPATDGAALQPPCEEPNAPAACAQWTSVSDTMTMDMCGSGGSNSPDDSLLRLIKEPRNVSTVAARNEMRLMRQELFMNATNDDACSKEVEVARGCSSVPKRTAQHDALNTKDNNEILIDEDTNHQSNEPDAVDDCQAVLSLSPIIRKLKTPMRRRTISEAMSVVSQPQGRARRLQSGLRRFASSPTGGAAPPKTNTDSPTAAPPMTAVHSVVPSGVQSIEHSSAMPTPRSALHAGRVDDSERHSTVPTAAHRSAIPAAGGQEFICRSCEAVFCCPCCAQPNGASKEDAYGDSTAEQHAQRTTRHVQPSPVARTMVARRPGYWTEEEVCLLVEQTSMHGLKWKKIFEHSTLRRDVAQMRDKWRSLVRVGSIGYGREGKYAGQYYLRQEGDRNDEVVADPNWEPTPSSRANFDSRGADCGTAPLRIPIKHHKSEDRLTFTPRDDMSPTKKWTEEECEQLVHWVNKLEGTWGMWASIKEMTGTQRSNVQLKDKWRNLIKYNRIERDDDGKYVLVPAMKIE